MTNIRPQYQAAYGLWKVLFDSVEFTNQLREILEGSKASWLMLQRTGHSEERYRTVRLQDTFFSDTIEQSIIDQLVDGARRFEYSIRLLLLDPLGRLARSRADTLGINPVRETNRALASLRSAVKKADAKGHRGADLLDRDRQDTLEYLEDQLKDLRDAREAYAIDVRFYNVLTETPVYIIHQFALKGQIKHRTSARDNPWMVFVDDPNQEDDVYDFFLGNFDSIWEHGSTGHPGSGDAQGDQASCFTIIPFGAAFTSVWTAIQHIADEFSLIPIRGDTDPIGQVFAKFREGIRDAALVITDITGLRPNVMFETGMACEMEKPMLILTQDSTDALPRDVGNLQTIGYSIVESRWPEEFKLRLMDAVSTMRELVDRRLRGVSRLAAAGNLTFEVTFKAHRPVATCFDAAAARHISLTNELKTLIIKRPRGEVAVHLPGDMKISPRRLKEVLGVSEYAPLEATALADRYLAETGTVCPFTKRVWQLEHLIDPAVLERKTMFTNNGSKTGFVRFNPRVLEMASHTTVVSICN